MKVLLISPFPPPMGGIARWTKMVLDYSKKQGDEIEVINISSMRESVVGRSFFKRLKDGVFTTLSAYLKLKKSMRKWSPHIVHITSSGSLSFLRDYFLLRYLKKKKKGSIYHLHFGKIPELKEKDNWMWHLFLKNAKNASVVVTIDESSYDSLIGIIDKNKLSNIPNPIDLETLPEPTEYKEHEKYIFYLGWVIKEKGIEELLLAWHELKKENKDWKLKIAGPLASDYREYLEKDNLLEDVEILPELSHDEAMEYMKRAGIFVLPSYTEGFPNVILEAMALKTPVVATKVGAIPEMLKSAESLVNSKNYCELRDVIDKLIKSDTKRQEISDMLYKRAVYEYNIEVIYQKYKNMWERYSV